MHNKTKIVLCFFVAIGVCIQQSLAQKLLLGKSVTLKDKQTGVYYASVQRNEGDLLYFSLPISLSEETEDAILPSSMVADSFVVDGVKYANGDVVRVKANVSQHKLVYAEKNEQKELSFVLTSLPLITINRQSDTSFGLDTPVLTQFAIYDPYCRTDSVSFFTSYANVSLRGATASMMEKKSYKVELVDESFTEENDANLFGIRTNDSWILDAAAIDYSRIRNRVCTDVWNKMSTLRDEDMVRNGTQGVYCELMLDDTYQGVYCFTDKISRKLLGLKKVDGEGDDAEVRGVLYKCKGNDYGTSKLKKDEKPWDRYNTDMWYDWNLKYPDDIYDGKVGNLFTT